MGKDKKTAGQDDGVLKIEKCIGAECKSNAKRFSFCSEHFEQYKFGLINKKGQPVPDFEKKFGQYTAYKQGLAARKVA